MSFNFMAAITSAVILEPKKIKSVTISTVSELVCHEVMGPGLGSVSQQSCFAEFKVMEVSRTGCQN